MLPLNFPLSLLFLVHVCDWNLPKLFCFAPCIFWVGYEIGYIYRDYLYTKDIKYKRIYRTIPTFVLGLIFYAILTHISR